MRASNQTLIYRFLSIFQITVPPAQSFHLIFISNQLLFATENFEPLRAQRTVRPGWFNHASRITFARVRKCNQYPSTTINGTIHGERPTTAFELSVCIVRPFVYLSLGRDWNATWFLQGVLQFRRDQRKAKGPTAWPNSQMKVSNGLDRRLFA